MPYLINKTRVGFKNGDHYIGVDAFVDQTVEERMAEINRNFADLVAEYNTAIDNYTTQGDKFLNGDPDAAAGTTERDGFIQTINAKIAEGTAYESGLEETLTNTETRINNKVLGAESRIDSYIDQELLPNFTDITQITNMINGGFNPNHDYKAGDFIIYTTTNASNQTESKLYKFITDHPAGEWIGPEGNNADVIEITFGEEVEDLKNNLVLASDTEPTYTDNRVWLNESKSTEYEVPTWEEFEELSENTIEKTLSPTLKETPYSSDEIKKYDVGVLNYNSGYFAKGDTTNTQSTSAQYQTYIYHFTDACDFYIAKTGGLDTNNTFVAVLYNQELQTGELPTSSLTAQNLVAEIGRYTGSNSSTLPTLENMWHAEKGYTLAISRREWTQTNHESEVTDEAKFKYVIYSTYNDYFLVNSTSLNTNHINQILNTPTIKGIENELFGIRKIITSKNILPVETNELKINEVNVTYSDGTITLNGGPATGSSGRLRHASPLFTLPAGTYSFFALHDETAEIVDKVYLERPNGNSAVTVKQSVASTTSFTIEEDMEVFIGVNVTTEQTYDQVKYNIYLYEGTEPQVLEKPSTTTITAQDYIVREELDKISLKNKKWAVLGDSFTEGIGSHPRLKDGLYGGQKATYPYIIGNRTGIKVLSFFKSGRTLAFPAAGSFENSITNPNADFYYQNIPKDVDYITIYLGINDWHAAEGVSGDEEAPPKYIPLGTINDDTVNSHYGAWNVVLTWLLQNRPNAHIGVIITNGCWMNENRWTDEYRQAQINICKKYGIPYIDLNGDSRTRAMIRTSNPDISLAVKNQLIANWAIDPGHYDENLRREVSNTHPNQAAHEYESTIIENFLRSL